MLLLLRLKTSYLQKLPWLFVGLAHVCQQTSREIGAQILRQWELDPRPEAHHRITAKLLSPGSFLESLKAWVEGANFDDLCEPFQRQVSAWRFTPIVETTIEEKHARVALSKRSRRLGPVRISLSNRLPLMERWIRKNTISATDLLERFNRTRSLKTVPALLGLQDHPALEGSGLS